MKITDHSGVARVPATPVNFPAFGPAEPRIARFESQRAHRGARVLVADGSIDSTVGLATFVEVLGHDARTAYDGRTALELALGWRPDVLFLDLVMPLIDGHDVCRRIRQEPWGRRALIVAVTGFGRPADRWLSRDAGFDRHLVKPVNPRAIVELLQPWPLCGRSPREPVDLRAAAFRAVARAAGRRFVGQCANGPSKSTWHDWSGDR